MHHNTTWPTVDNRYSSATLGMDVEFFIGLLWPLLNPLYRSMSFGLRGLGLLASPIPQGSPIGPLRVYFGCIGSLPRRSLGSFGVEDIDTEPGTIGPAPGLSVAELRLLDQQEQGQVKDLGQETYYLEAPGT